jgi:hypothetical protein
LSKTVLCKHLSKCHRCNRIYHILHTPCFSCFPLKRSNCGCNEFCRGCGEKGKIYDYHPDDYFIDVDKGIENESKDKFRSDVENVLEGEGKKVEDEKEESYISINKKLEDVANLLRIEIEKIKKRKKDENEDAKRREGDLAEKVRIIEEIKERLINKEIEIEIEREMNKEIIGQEMQKLLKIEEDLKNYINILNIIGKEKDEKKEWEKKEDDMKEITEKKGKKEELKEAEDDKECRDELEGESEDLISVLESVRKGLEEMLKIKPEEENKMIDFKLNELEDELNAFRKRCESLEDVCFFIKLRLY